VRDLALHCEDKQHNPIAEQYGPENRYIKYRKEGHQKSHTESLCDRIPESIKRREKNQILSLY
jgi:rRNA maturation protein Nop10